VFGLRAKKRPRPDTCPAAIVSGICEYCLENSRAKTVNPLSSKIGTHNPFLARCWPGLASFSTQRCLTSFKVFSLRLEAASLCCAELNLRALQGCTLLQLRSPLRPTLASQPSTINSQLSTLDPQSSILNPEPSARIPKG